MPGDEAVVEVRVASPAWDEYSKLALVPPDGVGIAGPVRGSRLDEQGNVVGHSITWDLRPHVVTSNPEPLALRFMLGDKEVAQKQLVVSNNTAADKLVYVSPIRAGASFWDRLLYPGEPAFDANSPIQGIQINYGTRDNTLFGLGIHWIITFFVVSILGALAVKPIVKVQF